MVPCLSDEYAITDRYVTDLRDVPTQELERELDLRRYPYWCKTHQAATVNSRVCVLTRKLSTLPRCDVTKRRTQ